MTQKMNKKAIIIIAGIIVLLICSISMYCKRKQKTAALANQQIAGELQAKGEMPSGIRYYPSGKLDVQVPAAITVLLPYNEKVDANTTINYEKAKECVKIQPPIKGLMVWTDARTIEYRFDEILIPETKYQVKINCIMLQEDKKKSIEELNFDFTTPPLKILSGFANHWNNSEIEAQVRWNYPIDGALAGNYIKVIGTNNQEVRVRSVALVKDDPQALLVTFKNIAKSYKFEFKQGLPIKDKKTGLKNTELFELPTPAGDITITGISLTEGEDTYSVKILCTITQGNRCIFDINKVRTYISVEPSINYKLVASDAGLELYADFAAQHTYEVKVAAGLQTRDGFQLKNEFKQSVRIPAATPKVAFAIQGMYLGKSGGAQIPLRVRKMKDININVMRLPTRNLSTWFYDKGGEDWGFNQLAEPIVTNKKITVDAGEKNKLFWLDLNAIFDTTEEGIYRIQVNVVEEKKKAASGQENNEENENNEYNEGYDYYGGNSNKMTRATIIISDISIVTKVAKSQVNIWTLNSSTLEPVKKAQMQLLSSKNVIMGGCTTDSSGFCKIAYNTDRERYPYVLTANKEKEFSFVQFDRSTLPTTDFDVSGTIVPKSKYLGFYYPERDLYRPGEMAHVAFILREYGSYKGVNVPVILYVRDPQGKDWLTLHAKTDEAGLAEFKIPTEVSSVTGKYSLEFKVGDEVIESGYLFIEEFVPQRIKVSLHTDKTEYMSTDQMSGDIQADYLFGAPASGQSFELQCKLDESVFQPKGYSDYIFGVYRKDKLSESLPLQNGTLDDKGNAAMSCITSSPLVDANKFKAPVKLSMIASVFESGSGRSSKSQSSVLIHPTNYYIGLMSPNTNIQPGKDVEIKGVIVDKKGNLMSSISKLKYQIYRLSYNYVRIYDSAQNKFSWQWSEMEIPYNESQDLLASNAKFSFTFQPSDYWSNYKIEVADAENSAMSSFILYSWSYYYNERKISSPELLEVKFDKEKADYNDSITASVRLPFEGKILWSTELDEVMNYKWADAKGETAKYEFSVPGGTSTVYASALLLTSNEKYAVRRAFGIGRLPIKPAEHMLKVEINAPEKTKPNTMLDVSIKSSEYFEGTVAIVDEGILQITQFKTPHPYDGIFTDLALTTSTAETFGWLIRKDTYQAPGGGEAAKVGETPSFVRIVSYWSGIVKSNEQGYASVKFPIPPYEGKLRVMVSAVNSNKIGEAEKYVQVRSDLSVMPTMPRFAHFNDQIQIPISFTNNIKSDTSTSLTVNITGADLTTDYPRTINLKPQKSEVVHLPVRVTTDLEPMNIEITAKTNNETYHEKFSMWVKPSKPYITEMNFIELKNGKNQFADMLKEWIPNREKVQMLVTPLPAVSRLKHLTYLIQYPYGCIEQTSSTLLPLIHMQDILDLIDPELADKAHLSDKINSGIRRLLSMQTTSGGFAYWPGETEAAVWPSVYATYILLDAKNAGFIVPQGSINSALNFISGYARKWSFGYYVLALGDYSMDQNINDMLALANKPDLNSEESLFLSGALNEAGKSQLAQQVLEKALKMNPQHFRNLSENFYSDLRELALRLYFSEKIYPGGSQNEALTMALIKEMGEPSWYYSTQELAWSIAALSERIRNVKYAKQFTANLYVDSKEQTATKTKYGMQWKFDVNKETPKEVYVDVNADGKVYLYVEIKGFKRNAQFLQYANGIELQRKYLDFEGKPVNKIKQKDLVLVELDIHNKSGMQLQNTAISDYLPAGLDIENPRLNPDNLPTWIKKDEVLNPDYVDYRDDHIDIFGTINQGTLVKFYYVARATIIGEYFLPPCEAVVMYQPQYKSKTAESQITVLGGK